MRQKKEINIQIGEQVRLAREKAKVTQEQLAERIDVSPQYVSDLERGVVGPSVSTIKRICISLNVSSDQLLFGKIDREQLAPLADIMLGLSPAQQAKLIEGLKTMIAAISPKSDS